MEDNRGGVMKEGSRADREKQFWDNYIKLIHSQGIKPPFDRWSVKRAEAFIGSFPGKRLAELTAEDVSGYLRQVGQDGRLKPWQFRQVVEAIRQLYNIVRTTWSGSFDWNFWVDSAKTLDPQHATTARSVAPVTAEQFSERLGDTRFAPLIRTHLDFFTHLSSVIRTRGLAFRTEQSYMAWVCRFMLHFGGVSPLELGAEQVGGFLQYLAVERNVAASTHIALSSSW
jgi:hypothetical protein